jgi:hypothetical protein
VTEVLKRRSAARRIAAVIAKSRYYKDRMNLRCTV